MKPGLCQSGLLTAFLLVVTTLARAAPSWRPSGRIDGLSAPVITLAFSPDGLHLLGGAEDRMIYLWQGPGWRRIHRLESSRNFSRVYFSTDSYDIFVFGPRGYGVVDIRGNVVYDPPPCLKPGSGSGMFFPDGSGGCGVRVTEEAFKELKGAGAVTGHTSLSRDGRIVASLDEESRTPRVISLLDGKRIVLAGTPVEAEDLAVSPDGRELAVAGLDGDLHLFDLRSGQETATIEAAKDALMSVAFSPDGATIAVGGHDRSVSFYRRGAGTRFKSFAQTDESPIDGLRPPALCRFSRYSEYSEVQAAAFSPDDRYLAWSDDDGQFRLVDLRGCCLVRRWNAGGLSAPFQLEFVGSGRRLLSGSRDRLRLWDIPSFEIVASTAHGWISAVLDSGRVVVDRWDSIDLLSLLDFSLAKRFTVPQGVAAMTIDDDGRRVQVPLPGRVRSTTSRPLHEAGRLVSRTGKLALDWRPFRSLDVVSTESGAALPPPTRRVTAVFEAPGEISLDLGRARVVSLRFAPRDQMLEVGLESGDIARWDLFRRRLADDRLSPDESIFAHDSSTVHRLCAVDAPAGMSASESSSTNARYPRFARSEIRTSSGYVQPRWIGDCGHRPLWISTSGVAFAGGNSGLTPIGSPVPSAGPYACARDSGDFAYVDASAHVILRSGALEKPRDLGATGMKGVRLLAVSPDGNAVAAAGEDDKIVVAGVDGRRAELDLAPMTLTQIALSSASRTLAFGTLQGVVGAVDPWNPAAKEEWRYQWPIGAVAISDDSGWVASGTGGGRVALHSLGMMTAVAAPGSAAAAPTNGGAAGRSEPAAVSSPSPETQAVPVREGAAARDAAVLIGISRYREDGVGSVSHALNDVTAVSETMRRSMSLGADGPVTLADQQASKADIMKFLRSWLRNHSMRGGRSVIYFSGLGSTDSDGSPYLLPYDGDAAAVDETGIAVQSILDAASGYPSSNVVVMIDAAFNGRGGRAARRLGMRPLRSVREDALRVPRNATLILADGGNGEALEAESARLGLLTHFSIPVLPMIVSAEREPDDEVGDLLMKSVERTAAARGRRQSPLIIFGESHERRGAAPQAAKEAP